MTSGLLIKEGEVIYDMCWYPAMNSQDPGSCCVLSSSRDHPVHLWDAYTGEVGRRETVMEKESDAREQTRFTIVISQ